MIPCSRYIIYPITWYSVLILTGALLAVCIAAAQEKRQGFPKDTMIDLALRIIPVGIVSARIYYVVFSWEAFRDDFFSVFRIWEGGLAIYGGILGGLVTIILFCRKRHLSFYSVCDAIVPGLSIAQAIGRWGNFFNMEAYGKEVTNPSFCFFPVAVLIPGETGAVWHLATFFYESCWDFIVFIILMRLGTTGTHKEGRMLATYLVLYASARLIIEELREDSLYFNSVRISQLLSILLILIVLLSMIFRLIRTRKGKSFSFLFCLFEFVYIIVSGFTVYSSVFGLSEWIPDVSHRILLFFVFSVLSVIHLVFLSRWTNVRRNYADIKV